jgi:hypothetical protein
MMSGPFKFADSPRGGALADAADRFDRVASTVKDQQLARTRSGKRAPESEAYVSSPEEAWSKKYMIQCVGPVCTVRPTDAGALLLPRFQPEAQVQAAAQSVEIAPAASVPAADPVPIAAPAAAEKPSRRTARTPAEPIGLAIGKNVRKRSLLGRMFGR